MKRPSLYSAARPRAAPPAEPRAAAPSADPAPAPRVSRLESFGSRHQRPLLVAAGALLAALLVALHAAMTPAPRHITQRDIDNAVRHSLETHPLPSRAAQAYEAVAPAIVRVQGVRKAEAVADGAAPSEGSTGSGVVVHESGVILTSLHVIEGTDSIAVDFATGEHSEAEVIAVQPENDLAVLRARTLPDDLVPATLGAAADLKPGDDVIAVGFPFGIGPSVTSGVISGLNREYQAPDGGRSLSRLIQFDAAANPGSSGGPLVTATGEVVGIVTGILNPSDQRVFAGIAFAVPIETASSAVGLPPF
ncbi:MAG TPA: trypsin-like peptidase domain-containing protein [Burkholderiales bacterium]